MARSEGLALAPWGVLAGGKIRSNAEEARRKESGEKGRTILDPNWERTQEHKKVCDVLEEIAKEVDCENITASVSWLPLIPGRDYQYSNWHNGTLFALAVAIAYHLQKAPYVFPIIGCRKVEQLQGNLAALDILLTPEQIKRIENAAPFDPGFPNKMIVCVVLWHAHLIVMVPDDFH
jgi:aryl-alcohol dehydrogenase-like predicted oxidoreductase